MSDRREFRDLASPDTLRSAIADLDLGGGTETASLREARGRVLAERVDAPIDVPGFDRAAMDGYAVRAADTVDDGAPVLDVAGSVHPGEEPHAAVEAGTAVEVSTGAPLPDGADAVVKVEVTDRRDAGVAVRQPVAPGDNVMTAGADVAAGERALGEGTRLTAREVGLLSALGVDAVPVVAAPRVGIVSTGSELIEPGDSLDHDAGQIHDVNGNAIAAAVEAAGGQPVRYPGVGDDEAALERVLTEAAADCDLVLSSGSTSASTTDVVYRVIEDRGELLLHGAAVKPGKPTLVGRIGGAAYVGLPGYPVSALSIFRTFVAPAVREAAGLPERRTATVEATMAARARFEEGRLRLLPVGLVEDGDGATLAYPVDKGSGATTTLVDADGVVAVDPQVDYRSPGEAVAVDLFAPDARVPRVLAVGEDDPALARGLDAVENPRYRSAGSRAGVRSLRDGVADAAVVAGPVAVDAETTTVGAWTREWGLVVAGDAPAVGGLADLVDRDVAFANRDDQSGLRASFDAALSGLAAERGTERAALADAVRGYGLETRAHESPARRVARGDADVGLGLRATAADLDLSFVSLGEEAVRVLAAPGRAEKPGVADLASALDGIGDRVALPGFSGTSR
ncbi:MAG: molybdopterin biosynthesis protein [Halobacteriaceae archaeon]